MEEAVMRYALLLILASACGGPSIEDSEEADTDTDTDTDTDVEDIWEASFWVAQEGDWAPDLDPLGHQVAGMAQDHRGTVVGAGNMVYRWEGDAWEEVVDDEAPGQINGFAASGDNYYIAVGEKLYAWLAPGVWARWLEPAPAPVDMMAMAASTRLVGIGSQLYYWSAGEETWSPYGAAAPGDIFCLVYIGGDTPQTLIGAGDRFYALNESYGWDETDTLPQVPYPLVGGCTRDGEGQVILATNQMQ